jgi:hypothetical protein
MTYFIVNAFDINVYNKTFLLRVITTKKILGILGKLWYK